MISPRTKSIQILLAMPDLPVEKLALSPFTVIMVSIGALPFFLALLSLIKKSTENELLVILLSF